MRATYFHGSPDENLTLVTGTGLFGGIFVADREAAATHGGNLYQICLGDSVVLDVISRVDWGIIESVIRGATSADSDDDVQSLYDAINTDENLDESLWHLLLIEEQDAAYARWEIQRLRGLIASAAGYTAVECEDEHGGVLLVLPGAEMLPAV